MSAVTIVCFVSPLTKKSKTTTKNQAFGNQWVIRHPPLYMRSRRPVNWELRKSGQELSQPFIVRLHPFFLFWNFLFNSEAWQNVDKSSLFSEALPLDCTYCESQRTTCGDSPTSSLQFAIWKKRKNESIATDSCSCLQYKWRNYCISETRTNALPYGGSKVQNNATIYKLWNMLRPAAIWLRLPVLFTPPLESSCRTQYDDAVPFPIGSPLPFTEVVVRELVR